MGRVSASKRELSKVRMKDPSLALAHGDLRSVVSGCSDESLLGTGSREPRGRSGDPESRLRRGNETACGQGVGLPTVALGGTFRSFLSLLFCCDK